MWFRNLQLYRLIETFEHSPESLHAALEQRAFKPCAGLDTYSMGWVPPAGRETTQLVHAANGRIMVCLRREDRILPSAVVREHVEEKAEAIALAESRPVGRKEKQQIKEEVIIDLLPRAFTRSTHMYAYIDPKDGWAVVDSGTAKKAEELLSALRETLGSLRLKPLAVNNAPASVLTRWLETSTPAGFELGDECELKEPVDKGGVMRGRRMDLASAEVKSHLDAGMQVAKLAVRMAGAHRLRPVRRPRDPTPALSRPDHGRGRRRGCRGCPGALRCRFRAHGDGTGTIHPGRRRGLRRDSTRTESQPDQRPLTS